MKPTLTTIFLIYCFTNTSILFSQESTIENICNYDELLNFNQSFESIYQLPSAHQQDINGTQNFFSGYITDLYTGAPISGIEIIVEGDTTFTDLNGFYSINKSNDSLVVFTDRFLNYYNYEDELSWGGDDIRMVPITMHSIYWLENHILETLQTPLYPAGAYYDDYWEFPIKVWFDQTIMYDHIGKDLPHAFEIWERVTDIDLFELVPDEPQGPPWIKFQQKQDGGWSYNSIIGTANYSEGIIYYQDYGGVTVAAHELGHGLNVHHHDGDPTSIMSPSESPYWTYNFSRNVSHTDGEYVKMRNAFTKFTDSNLYYRHLVTSTDSLGNRYKLDDLKQLYPKAVSGSYPDYLIRGTFIVQASDTVWIEPGTTVKLNGQLKIGGVLISEGTPEKIIIFTSYNDQKGGWNRIYIMDGGSIKMDYSIVENAEAGVVAHHSFADIGNSIFRNNWYGVFIVNLVSRNISSNIYNCQFLNNDIGLQLYFSRSSITKNTFTGNYISITDYRSEANVENNIIYGNNIGIQVSESTETTYLNNSISDNADYSLSFLNRLGKNNAGVGLELSYQLENFDNNWWGTIDESLISQSIYDGNDETGAYPYVNY